MKPYIVRYDNTFVRSQRGHWGRVVRTLDAGERFEGTPVEGEAIVGCETWVELANEGGYIPLCILDVE